jgi:hypothetical protein
VSGIPNLSSAAASASNRVEASSPTQRATDQLRQLSRRRGFDVTAILADMELKDSVRAAVDPLNGLGLTLSPQAIESAIDSREHKVTMLGRGGETHYLIELPPQVLRSGGAPSQSLLSQLPHLFPLNSSVYLLGHKIDALPLALMNIIAKSSPTRIRFVPWLHLVGPPHEPQEAKMLLFAFGFTATTENGRARRRVTDEDIRLVAERLAAYLLLPGGDASIRFTDFVSGVEFPDDQKEPARSVWNGNASQSAANLTRLANFCGRRVLGCVVSELIVRGPGTDDSRRLFELATAGELIPLEQLARLDRMIREAFG